MGRWVDEWTGVRSQLTCVILESLKTIQHLLTVHTHSLSHIHKTPLPLEEVAKRKSAGLFRLSLLETSQKKALNKFDLVFGGRDSSSVQLSCLVPLFVLKFVYDHCLSIFLM